MTQAPSKSCTHCNDTKKILDEVFNYETREYENHEQDCPFCCN